MLAVEMFVGSIMIGTYPQVARVQSDPVAS